MAELTQKELEVLAYTILGEAGGEGRVGMEAVANVIFNRAESGRFSDNPALVALQKNTKGVHQFSAWNPKGSGGNSPMSKFRKDSKEFQEALAVVQRVAAGEVPDTTGGATHYYSKDMMSEKPSWFDAEGPAGEVEIGGHVFAAKKNPSTTGVTARRKSQVVAPQPQTYRGPPRKGPVAPTPAPITQRPTSGSSSSTSSSANGGLISRKVTTVPVDRFGNPVDLMQQGLEREAARLRVIKQNANDEVGPAARTSSSNTASASKQPRAVAPRDLVGTAATKVVYNRASTQKQPRKVSALETALKAKAEQQRQAQVYGQYAASRTAAPKTPVPPPRQSGVTRTTGGIAGTVQLPPGVRPSVTVKPPVNVPKLVAKPSTTVTKFMPSPTTPPVDTRPRSTVLPSKPLPAPPPDPSKRMTPGQPLFIAGENVPLKKPITVPTGPRGRGRGKPPVKTAAAMAPNIKPTALTEPEIAVVTQRRPVFAPPPVKTPQQLMQERLDSTYGVGTRIGSNGMLYRPTGAGYQRVGVADQVMMAMTGRPGQVQRPRAVTSGTIYTPDTQHQYGEGGGDYGSSPGQSTAGMRPGERGYDPVSNSWYKK